MIKTGDIILSHTNNISGVGIVWFLNLIQKDPVKYSHVSIASSDSTILQARITIHEISFIEASKKWSNYSIYRRNDISDDVIDRMIWKGRKLVGMRYSYSRIVLQFFDGLFNTNKFTGSYSNNKNHICSSLIAWLYYTTFNKYLFNDVHWRSCEPDDIDDDIQTNSQLYTLVDQK